MGPNFGFISNCKVGCKTDFLVTADQGKKPLLREISTAKQNVPFVLWVALKLGSTLYREALCGATSGPPAPARPPFAVALNAMAPFHREEGSAPLTRCAALSQSRAPETLGTRLKTAPNRPGEEGKQWPTSILW